MHLSLFKLEKFTVTILYTKIKPLNTQINLL